MELPSVTFHCMAGLLSCLGQIIPVRISCILVVTLAIEQLQFLLLQVICLVGVVRDNLITILQHVHLEIIHLDLEIKVLDCLLVTDHLDACIFEISRCFDLLVEALLDTRMLPTPLIVVHRFV